MLLSGNLENCSTDFVNFLVPPERKIKEKPAEVKKTLLYTPYFYKRFVTEVPRIQNN